VLCFGDDHQFLVIDREGFQPAVRDRIGDEGGVEVRTEDLLDQLARIARIELEGHVRIAIVEATQRLRQAGSGRAFHRAQAQHAAGPIGLDRLDRFLREIEHAVRVADQYLARGRKLKAAPFAQEQLHAQFFFEHLDARGHARLCAVKGFRRPHHAAGADHGPEDLQIRELHTSPSLNGSFSICRFLASAILFRVLCNFNKARA